MDILPARNLGAGEPWGRTVEMQLAEQAKAAADNRQLAENQARTAQAALATLTGQMKRTSELVEQLDETVDRLPRYSISVGEDTAFQLTQGKWTTAAVTTVVVPGDRSYAVIDCEAIVQMTAANGTLPGGLVWMAVMLTGSYGSTSAPTGIGIPMQFIETTSGVRRTGTVNHRFHVDNVAGQVLTVQIRLYANDSVAQTQKSATISASGMFLRNRGHITDIGGGVDELVPEGTPDPGSQPPPPDPNNDWKWPMHPDAINSRHSGGTSGGYENPIRPDHNGLDFSWPPKFYAGMPIRAAAAGTVHKAYWEPGGGGWAVEIKHSDRWYTGYYHGVPGSIQVSPGQPVTQGQHLLNAGESGNSTGPHLHFMVVDMYKTGSYWTSHMDPELFMAEYNPNDLYV